MSRERNTFHFVSFTTEPRKKLPQPTHIYAHAATIEYLIQFSPLQRLFH